MGPTDALLLGTDLVKDPATLEAAYDDSLGLTAAFNKNVLTVINRELGGEFDLDAFEHVSYWDEELQRIEMRLRSRVDQSVPVAGLGLTAEFAAGEEMRTEVSCKFTPERVADELEAAGCAWRPSTPTPPGCSRSRAPRCAELGSPAMDLDGAGAIDQRRRVRPGRRHRAAAGGARRARGAAGPERRRGARPGRELGDAAMAVPCDVTDPARWRPRWTRRPRCSAACAWRWAAPASAGPSAPCTSAARTPSSHTRRSSRST